MNCIPYTRHGWQLENKIRRQYPEMIQQHRQWPHGYLSTLPPRTFPHPHPSPKPSTVIFYMTSSLSSIRYSYIQYVTDTKNHVCSLSIHQVQLPTTAQRSRRRTHRRSLPQGLFSIRSKFLLRDSQTLNPTPTSALSPVVLSANLNPSCLSSFP
jgi:hypothetical protein